MGRMNLGRIVVGGLIAGFAYNVVNWIGHGLILEAVSTDTMAEPHIAPPSIGQRVQLWSIWMLYGVMVAWLYAAMRPRFGEGFRTAAFAATTVWIVGIVVPALPNWVLGFFLTRNHTCGLVGGDCRPVDRCSARRIDLPRTSVIGGNCAEVNRSQRC